MNYIDLDIICDGLFILSCLGEFDIHRKVRKRENVVFRNDFIFRKYLVLMVLKC